MKCLLTLTIAFLMVFVEPRVALGQTRPLEEEIKQIEYQINEFELGRRSSTGIDLNEIRILQYLIEQSQEQNLYEAKAFLLLRIGFIFNNIGYLEQALEYYTEALDLMKEFGSLNDQAFVLTNIGRIYSGWGQPQRALDHYEQALSLFQQTDNSIGEARILNNLGAVYVDLGQPRKALEFFNQARFLFDSLSDQAGEATVLNNIGETYRSIDNPRQASIFFNQALPLFQEINDLSGEARVLNNIGLNSVELRERQDALEYFTLSHSLFQAMADPIGEATTLVNFASVYYSNDPTGAEAYLKQALSIFRGFGERAGEVATLRNIGWVNESLQQRIDAIDSFEEAMKITLEMRRGLVQINRKAFLQTTHDTITALIHLLILEEENDKAFEWLNLATTTELLDYARLIGAESRISDPTAQQMLNDWKYDYQQLEILRRRLQQAGNFSEELSREMRNMEEDLNRRAEEIADRFPEISELFETSVEDIAELKRAVPSESIIIQPVLLTDVEGIPDSIVLFIISKNRPLIARQISIDSKDFNDLVNQYRQELQNPLNSTFAISQEQLYNFLIRPIEADIDTLAPKRISFILTGSLRYIPFETLYDNRSGKYLIEKYPINYLTRLSTNNLATSQSRTPPPLKVLAVGNPISQGSRSLPGAEQEVGLIAQIAPGSEVMIHEEANLDNFRLQAPRFSYLHLATHGCFDPQGCPELNMQPNTLLFSDQQYHIADASLLGLNNVELIVLSACKTAQEADSNGEEIAGLAYLFERAGARAVIASIWNAEDDKTKEIMVDFYQNLSDGMSKADSLRQAKLKHVKDHPFFWGPLILIGNDN